MTYKQHPLSAAFPSMSDDDFAALVADIEANGQRDPVVLFEGMVIDGWHRTRACDQLAQPLLTIELQAGIDPVAFVLSRNLHRRHLTASQRAMAVAACAKWLPVGAPANSATVALLQSSEPEPEQAAKSLQELAEDAGVSRRTMAQAAKVVKQAAPEVAQAVKDGTLPVSQAAAIAALPKDEQPDAMSGAAPAPRATRKAKPAAGDDQALAALQTQLDAANEALAELTQNLQEVVADNTAMSAVFEADDKLAESLAQNKRLRAEVSGLRERVNGLMSEKNEAVRMVKHWRGRAERAEKAGATA
jgi:hypothetical protein